jgi:hypothetical protein
LNAGHGVFLSFRNDKTRSMAGSGFAQWAIFYLMGGWIAMTAARPAK